MGAGGSIPNSRKLDSLSADDIGDLVESLGPSFKPYAAAVRSDGVDGRMLEDLPADEIMRVAQVDDEIHLSKLTNELSKLQAASKALAGVRMAMAWPV